MFLTNASIIHSSNKCNRFLTNYSNNYNLLNASRLFSTIIINFPRQEGSAYQCPTKTVRTHGIVHPIYVISFPRFWDHE